MIQNYIDFKYNSNDELIAIIHKYDKRKVVTNEKDLRDLIRIARKYNYDIDGELRIVKNAREIREEFDKTRKRYVINKKSKGNGKRILAGTLAIFTVVAIAKIAGMIGEHFNQKDGEDTTISIPIDDDQIVKVVNYMDEYEENEPIINNDTIDNNDELNNMIEDGTFHYEYEDRSDSSVIQNVNQYDEIFQKYAKMYGVDANLLKAMAAQESGGDHYGNLEGGPATGIMQIENIWHIGYTTYAYNMEKKEIDAVDVDDNNIKDIDTNIRLGAMILRECLEYYDYNIPLAIQAYNFGMGNVDEVLAYCTTSSNISSDTIINQPSNNSWTKFRSYIDVGDSEYLEHVFSYLGDSKKISVQDRDGNTHTLTIENDLNLHKNKSI